MERSNEYYEKTKESETKSTNTHKVLLFNFDDIWYHFNVSYRTSDGAFSYCISFGA